MHCKNETMHNRVCNADTAYKSLINLLKLNQNKNFKEVSKFKVDVYYFDVYSCLHL